MTSGEPSLPGGDLPNQSAADVFYANALVRIKHTVVGLSLLLTPLGWLRFGPLPAAGFLLGAGVSYLNLYWLARAVNGLGGRIVDTQSPEKGEGIVARFLLRYLVIGAVVYVTFISCLAAFQGLLTGLCLPVAGMMGEAGYELYVAFRRKL
jgi:hypothetical protein